MAFFPIEDGQPVSGAQAFTRTYDLTGPLDSGLLLPGMRLQQGPRNLYGCSDDGTFEYNPQTRALSPMDVSTLLPPLSNPSGFAYDSKLGRMLLASTGGEGILYNFIFPDPTNAPASGLWTFFASLEGLDIDSITYVPLYDAFYAVTFSYGPGMPAKIVRFAPNGMQNGTIPLPLLPFEIGRNGYSAELVTVADYLVLMLEPRPGNNPEVKESRIYLINPATSEVLLTYSREIPGETDDTTPPAVELRSPPNRTNIVVGTPVTLSAIASDAGSGVDHVEFIANGVSIGNGVVSSAQTNLYSLSWLNAPLGTNSIAARATDRAGNVASTVPISLIVTNRPGTNQPPDTIAPFVRLRTPSGGETYKLGHLVRLTAEATDAGGISQVEFLRGGVVLARGNRVQGTPDLYAYSWSNAPLGTNILSARAIDLAGNASTSLTVSILVLSNSVPTNPPVNKLPVVRIVSPAPGSHFTNGPVRITAHATDPDGTIRSVDFLANGRNIGSVTSTNATNETFFIEWTPPTNAIYSLTARANDNVGGAKTSDAVRITVGPVQNNDLVSARRSLPDRFEPGHPFRVEVDVYAKRGVTWTVEDQVPPGWRVIGISHGGRFDAATRTVKFRPSNKSSRTLKYTVISLHTNVGTFEFNGTIAANNLSEAIGGDSETRAERKWKHVKIEKGRHGKVIIRIDPDQDLRWVVEYTESLRDRDWKPLPDAQVIIGENGEITIDDPGASSTTRRFYRLRLVETDDDDDDDDDREDD